MGVVELVGQLDLVADALAEPQQILVLGIAAHDEAELVTAEPGELHALRTKTLARPRGCAVRPRSARGRRRCGRNCR